ncbi:TPA: HNH endonuclease [Vibrio alginolyticus]
MNIAVILAPRRPPKGWTWHHEREKGSMVLVPREQHTIGSEEWKVLHPDNKGGYSTKLKFLSHQIMWVAKKWRRNLVGK